MIKVSFIGDLMCLKAQNEASMEKYGKLDFMPQFEACKRLFAGSNYVIGNLETPINPSRPLTEFDIRFNSSLKFLEAVKDLGVNFLSLANNHILDQGVEGLKETVECVEKMGFDYSGAYKNEGDSERIFIKEIDGVQFSVLCYTFGTNSQVNGEFLSVDELFFVDLLNKQKKMLQHWEPDPNAVCEKYIADEISIAAAVNSKNVFFQERLKEKILKAKQQSDFVMVIPHMGGQFNPHPGNYAKWMMNYIRECGANIIIAGHPHVPQKCLIENDVLECYSLGNFASTPNVGWYLPNSFSEYGVALHTYFDESTKKLKKITFSIVKNVVDEFGYVTVVPVTDLYDKASTIDRERMMIDCEEIISRVRGYNDNKNEILDEVVLSQR